MGELKVMIEIKHEYNAALVQSIKATYKGVGFPDIDMYGRNDATSIITIKDDTIREVIKNEDGVFKDVQVSFSDIKRTITKADFMFLETGDYTFVVYLNGFVSGDADALKECIKKAENISKAEKKKLVNSEKGDRKEAKNYYKELREKNGNHGRVPLGQRFRIPITFGLVGMIFNLIDMLDPLYGAAFSPNFGINSLLGCLISGLAFFIFGFFFIFFRIWFVNQSERKQIISIVLFPITVAVFAIIGIIGALPYIIHLFIYGDESYRLPSIINVAVKIAFVIVIVLLIALFAFLL